MACKNSRVVRSALADGAECAVADGLVFDDAEPDLDQVEPRPEVVVNTRVRKAVEAAGRAARGRRRAPRR